MIHPTLPFSDYLAHPAWGSSSLRAMRQGPPARVMYDRTNPREDTDATIFGTAVHAAFLTPDLFAASYIAKPDGMTFATKEGKAWRDENKGRIILPHDTYARVLACREALLRKPLVTLDGATAEASVFWNDESTDEACKGRPDWFDGEAVYDLKVSRHAGRPAALAYRAHADGWMHQLAHNRAGLNANGNDVARGRLVVIAPEAPQYIYTLEVNIDALDLMHLENIQALRALRTCRLAGSWPDTPDEWARIDAPIFNESDVSALDGAEEVPSGS